MKKLIKYFQIIAVVGFIIVEELGWKKIGEPVYNSIKQLKVMEHFKRWVSTVENRYLVLIIFMKPFILMEVFSAFGLIAFGSGHLIAGVLLYSIKFALTVPVVVIFNTAKDTLVSFFIIRYTYGIILNFKRSDVFRGTKSRIKEIKENLKALRVKMFGDKKSEFIEEMEVIYTKVKKI